MRTSVAFATESGISSALAHAAAVLASSADERLWFFYGHRAGEHPDELEQLLALKDRYLERLSLAVITDRDADEAELLSGVLDAAKIHALSSRFFDARTVERYFIFGPNAHGNEARAALTELGVEDARIQIEPSRALGTTGGAIASPSSAANGDAEASDSAATTTRTTAPAPSEAHGTPAMTPASATAHTAPAVEPPTNGWAEGTPAAPAPRAQPETKVSFVMDGRRRAFSMRTGDESILDAAARAGIELPFSCKAGVCSTCRTKLVRGEVDMAENYALEDWELEQGFILACQSRAKTPEIELTYDEI